MENPTLYISLAMFLILHLGTAIWFLSGMKSKVVDMSTRVAELTEAIKEMAKMDKRIAVLESRQNRTEEDIREATRAVAKVAADREK